MNAQLERRDVPRRSVCNRLANLRLFFLGEPANATIVFFDPSYARGRVLLDFVVFHPDAESQAEGGLPGFFVAGAYPRSVAADVSQRTISYLLMSSAARLPKAGRRVSYFSTSSRVERSPFSAVECSIASSANCPKVIGFLRKFSGNFLRCNFSALRLLNSMMASLLLPPFPVVYVPKHQSIESTRHRNRVTSRIHGFFPVLLAVHFDGTLLRGDAPALCSSWGWESFRGRPPRLAHPLSVA